HGLTFGPDPATHTHNTLGGMLGNNSCGTHSVEAHRTSDNTHSMDILTYDGLRMTVGALTEEELDKHCGVADREGGIYRGLRSIRQRYGEEVRARFPNIPRLVSGYALDQLLPEKGCHVARALVGSESTCVTILRATLNLIPDPPHKRLLVIGFDAIEHAADAVPFILKYKPIALEAVDDQLVSYMRKKGLLTAYLRHLPKGNSWLLAQFGGDTPEQARAHAQALQKTLPGDRHVTDSHLLEDPEARAEMWRVREAGLPATAFVPGMRDTWEGWEDSAVHPDKLGAYVRDFKALFEKYDNHGAIYGHFGDGLIHTRIDSGLHTEEEILHFRRYL
ncbi:MAG: FAD-binding protein, partial [Pseudomonadota bacterium]|nr:FAD-binding protein [Pseudomonadota bacterium]